MREGQETAVLTMYGRRDARAWSESYSTSRNTPGSYAFFIYLGFSHRGVKLYCMNKESFSVP